jgi:hypothetical protein
MLSQLHSRLPRVVPRLRSDTPLIRPRLCNSYSNDRFNPKRRNAPGLSQNSASLPSDAVTRSVVISVCRLPIFLLDVFIVEQIKYEDFQRCQQHTNSLGSIVPNFLPTVPNGASGSSRTVTYGSVQCFRCFTSLCFHFCFFLRLSDRLSRSLRNRARARKSLAGTP